MDSMQLKNADANAAQAGGHFLAAAENLLQWVFSDFSVFFFFPAHAKAL